MSAQAARPGVAIAEPGLAAWARGYPMAMLVTHQQNQWAKLVGPLRRLFSWASVACGSNRVNRGGSWNNSADNCRAANRNRNHPSNRNDNLGFRPAKVPHQARREAGARSRSFGRLCLPTAAQRKVLPRPVSSRAGAQCGARAANSKRPPGLVGRARPNVPADYCCTSPAWTLGGRGVPNPNPFAGRCLPTETEIVAMAPNHRGW